MNVVGVQRTFTVVDAVWVVAADGSSDANVIAAGVELKTQLWPWTSVEAMKRRIASA
jgi:hypothetical protein